MDILYLLSVVPTVLFRTIATTSLIVLPVIVLILIIRRLLRDHMPARWLYMIWLLLPIRLLIPWTPDSSISMYNFVNLPALLESTMSTSTPTEPNANLPSPDDPIDHPSNPNMSEVARDVLAPVSLNNSTDSNLDHSPESSITNAALIQENEINSNPIDQQNIAIHRSHTSIVLLILSWTWIIGAAITAAIMVRANFRFAGSLHRSPSHTVEPQLVELLDACKQQLRIRQHVKLIITDCVSSPALTGVIYPKLLLPAALAPALGEKQLQHIMLHELSHWKRRDLLVNLLMHTLLTIHWFNPLLWYAYARMREDQELACDALALSKLQPTDSRDYALTIIQLLESWSAQRRFVNAAGMSGSRLLLRRRITMIHSNKPTRPRRTLLGLASLLLIAGCSLTDGGTVDKPDIADTSHVTQTASIDADAMKDASLQAAHETNFTSITSSDHALSNQEIVAKYDGSQQLLASQDWFDVYGNVKVEYNINYGVDYSYDELTVEKDGESHTYPWKVVSDSSIHPDVRLRQDDVDHDGKKELVVITKTATWGNEGARNQESLHIINLEDWSETLLPDPVEAVKNAISSTVTRNDQMTTISFEFEGKRYTQEKQYYSLADGIPTQVVDHLVFGNTVAYSIVDGVIRVIVSASIDEESGASLSGFLSVIATYGPKLGKPTITITTNSISGEVWETTAL